MTCLPSPLFFREATGVSGRCKGGREIRQEKGNNGHRHAERLTLLLSLRNFPRCGTFEEVSTNSNGDHCRRNGRFVLTHLANSSSSFFPRLSSPSSRYFVPGDRVTGFSHFELVRESVRSTRAKLADTINCYNLVKRNRDENPAGLGFKASTLVDSQFVSSTRRMENWEKAQSFRKNGKTSNVCNDRCQKFLFMFKSATILNVEVSALQRYDP